MTLRNVITTLLASFWLYSPLLPAQDTKPWNVILITVDTLRADHLETYGYTKIRTPVINQWAQKGAVFEHAVASSPLTLPSHASILTGTFPFYHGVQDNAGFILSEDQLTLAEILSESGFATGAFVGSFVLDSRVGLDQGFDTYIADFQLTGMEVIAPGYIQRKADVVTQDATRWMTEQISRDRPFFGWIHFYDPHAPYAPPAEFSTLYPDRLYDGEIAYVDSVLETLGDFLRQSGIEDETMLILTSDHGESLGEHDEKTHGYFIYEATQHIPLIWVTPNGSLAGQRVTETVRSVDIAPTILQLLDIQVPATMQGSGLMPLLRGEEKGPREAYAETHYPRLRFGWSELRGLYRFPYKYIEAPRPELYDLAQDPGETNNLYTTHSAVARSLRDELLRLVDQRSRPSVQSLAAVDPQVAQSLGSLGYVSSTISTSSADPLADPKDNVSLYGRITDAHALIASGNLPGAVQSLEAILSENPDAVFVHHSLGLVHSRMGRHRQAVTDYRKAGEAFSDDPLLFFNMGTSYLQLKQWKAAAEAFERVLDIDPSHYRARSNLASLWLQAGRFRAALRASESILVKQPDYEPALFNAGLASLALEKEDQAILYLQKVLKINPRNANAHQYLGQAQELKKTKE
ncbi:MAG: sulfatase-like hydrolase/transferase [Acidobacteriota bacterium]